MSKHVVRITIEVEYNSDNWNDYPTDDFNLPEDTSDKDKIARMVEYDLAICPETIYLETPLDEKVEVL